MTREEFIDQIHHLTVKAKYEAYCMTNRSSKVYEQSLQEYNRVFDKLLAEHDRLTARIAELEAELTLYRYGVFDDILEQAQKEVKE